MTKLSKATLAPLGRQLADHRVRAGLSRAEAASRLGVPADTLYRWETGTRTPNAYVSRSVLQQAAGWPDRAE